MSLAPQHDFRMGTAFSPDRTRRLPGSFRWLLLWLALVAIVAGLIASTNIAGGFADRARSTSATVSAKEPTNHAIVRATYEVDGRTYEVADSFIGPPNPPFDDVRVGTAVTVYYDPNAPDRAVLSEPQKRSSQEIGFLVLAAAVLPAFFVGSLWLSFGIWRAFVRAVRTARLA